MARVMVIDGDPATLLAVRVLLARLGHEVVTRVMAFRIHGNPGIHPIAVLA